VTAHAAPARPIPMSNDSDKSRRGRQSRSRPERETSRLQVEVTGVTALGGARGLARWLVDVAPRRAIGTVAVAFVSDARMRALNRRYRKRDRVTDVLSFPAAEPESWPAAAGAPPLGDIVIARGRARRQALEAGHGVGAEARLLALHGLLHLLGYDHERDAGRMARVEFALRRKGRLGEGLIERATRTPSRRRAGKRR